MSNQYLSFDVTKEHDIQQLITGRQGDSQLKQVTLALWDGSKNIPYDLTDKTIKFEGMKSDYTNVIDKDGVTILNAKAGLARYQFNPQVFALPGHLKQAFFKIEHEDKKGNKTADSTLEVDIFVLENLVEQGIASEDYLSEYDAFIAKVKKKFDEYADAVQQNIDDVADIHQQIENIFKQLASQSIVTTTSSDADITEVLVSLTVKQPDESLVFEKVSDVDDIEERDYISQIGGVIVG